MVNMHFMHLFEILIFFTMQATQAFKAKQSKAHSL